MSTSVSIKGKTQANDAVTSTINYVNPNATDAQLVSLATAFNNLTTNTIGDVTRIDKTSLTASSKTPRNMVLRNEDDTADVTTIEYSSIPTSVDTTYLVKGEGLTLPELQISFSTDAGALLLTLTNDEDGIFLGLIQNTSFGSPYAGTVTISIPADNIYEAGSIVLTIT